MIVMSNVELLKKINEHLEFLMDCTIEPSDVRSSTKQLMDDIKSTICNSKSNGDMIRQMTDEELAEFLTYFDYGEICKTCCPISNEYENDSCMNFCDNFVVVVKDWIEQEVSDNE